MIKITETYEIIGNKRFEKKVTKLFFITLSIRWKEIYIDFFEVNNEK